MKMFVEWFMIYFLIIFSVNFSIGQNDWKNIETVEEAYLYWPDKIELIFENLNLDYPGLENVSKAYQSKDIILACQELLCFFEQSSSVDAIKSRVPKEGRIEEARGIVQDVFNFQEVKDTVPRDSNGHLDWTFKGPENDIEWAWALNRHYPIQELIHIYEITKDKKYINYIDIFIRDWIIQSDPYPRVKSSSEMWRGLEVSFRIKTWTDIFFRWNGEDGISPVTRLLILSSLPDHAHYVMSFHGYNNWLTMEMTGLATAAAYWPEFKDANVWGDFSEQRILETLKTQVYPDGAQIELSSHYHRAALSNFVLYGQILRDTKHPVPIFLLNTIEKMWDYLAYTIRPDGHGLLNNDSDLDFNQNLILNASKEFDRLDWKYIATNGEEGEITDTIPSRFFPWAGQMISRSGFDKDAHWSFFDVGPWGAGHQHNDKLHLSVSAFGQDFLVDGGRFAYRGQVAEKFRKYALGSHSHNVFLIDHQGQGSGPKITNHPISESNYILNDKYDYATGSISNFPGVKGAVKHTRSTYYLREKFWVVVDQVATDRPREIEALWHWHPDCEVSLKGDKVIAKRENGDLHLIPVNHDLWKIANVMGQEEPTIQGWYSPEYNVYKPSPTTVCSTKIDSNQTFVWMIYPLTDENIEVFVEVLNQSDNGIEMEVVVNGDSEKVSIPLPANGLSLENALLNGYHGIWFELNQKSQYGDKYSGGLGTYTAKHMPISIYAPEVNKTFFSYGGVSHEDSRYLLNAIGEYNHSSGIVSRPVVVCDKKGVDDPHDNSSILIDEKGYVWVFVSGRGQLRPGFKYKSRYPYSIKEFDQVTQDEMTYPQPWKMKDGFINLFTKYTGVRQLYFETSKNGEDWSEDVLLAAIPEYPGEKSGHYQISANYKNKKVGTFFNRHPEGNVDRRTDVYYVESSDMGLTWNDIEGNALQLPIVDVRSSSRVINYQSKGKNIYLKDMGFDERGYPIGLFLRSKGHEPGPNSGPYEWFIVKWNGNEWIELMVTSSDHNYDMGSLYIGRDIWRIIAPTTASEESPQPWGVGGEIEAWASYDKGMSWDNDKRITQNSKYNHSYVRRPLNYKSPFCFFWADGHPHAFSPSHLFFGDFEGSLWQLPCQMDGEGTFPEQLK